MREAACRIVGMSDALAFGIPAPGLAAQLVIAEGGPPGQLVDQLDLRAARIIGEGDPVAAGVDDAGAVAGGVVDIGGDVAVGVGGRRELPRVSDGVTASRRMRPTLIQPKVGSTLKDGPCGLQSDNLEMEFRKKRV